MSDLVGERCSICGGYMVMQTKPFDSCNWGSIMKCVNCGASLALSNYTITWGSGTV